MRILLPILVLFATNISFAEQELSAKLLNKILNTANRAKSHAAWHDDQQTLDKYKKNFFRAEITPVDRCTKLNSLTDENLLIFYDELMNSSTARELVCREELVNRMTFYLEQKNLALEKSYQNIAGTYLEKCSDHVRETFGPAQNLTVVSEGTSAFWGKKYPKCSITMTFDDGPHPQLTPQLLKHLNDESLLVNFFVVGRRVRVSPKLLREMDDLGHIIGNHTQNHKDLSRESYDDALKEIEDGYNAIIQALGKYIPFFRFPYGAATKDLRIYLNHLNRVEFFWNMDSRDWAIRDPEELFPYVLKEINNYKKGVLLMHDVQPQTIVVMPYLLRSLKEAGYNPVLVIPEQNTTYVP